MNQRADAIDRCAVAARWRDIVLALEDAEWFAPFDSVAVTRASLHLIDSTVSGLCDRMADVLGDRLRLVEADDAKAPTLEHPLDWWAVRGWALLDSDIVVRPSGEV